MLIFKQITSYVHKSMGEMCSFPQTQPYCEWILGSLLFAILCKLWQESFPIESVKSEETEAIEDVLMLKWVVKMSMVSTPAGSSWQRGSKA